MLLRKNTRMSQRVQHRDAVGARGVYDYRPGSHGPRGGQAGHHEASSESGTAISSSSARPATSCAGRTAVSGSRRSARCREACDIALHATTTWPARSRATPSALPTRPAEMIPTVIAARGVLVPHPMQ